jgi:hypothetical protein
MPDKTVTTPNAKLPSESYDEKFDRMKKRKEEGENKTTPEEEKPMMVMRLGEHGWRDLATVENREKIRQQRERLRQKAKETP